MDNTSLWVVVHSLSKELTVDKLVSIKGTRDDDSLSSYNHNSLTIEEFFGNNGGKSTKEMAFTIDNDFFLKHPRYLLLFSFCLLTKIKYLFGICLN